MAYLIMIIGAALMYFGFNRKIAADKPVGGMTGRELAKAGFGGYLKVMMIAGGAVFIFIGLLIKMMWD